MYMSHASDSDNRGVITLEVRVGYIEWDLKKWLLLVVESIRSYQEVLLPLSKGS